MGNPGHQLDRQSPLQNSTEQLEHTEAMGLVSDLGTSGTCGCQCENFPEQPECKGVTREHILLVSDPCHQRDWQVPAWKFPSVIAKHVEASLGNVHAHSA